jgi:2-hydroxychromene-2-carboxylate isomerase
MYFSFRSPYSWLAVERLRRRVPEMFGRLRMVPFWDPDPVTERAIQERGAEFHYTAMSKAKHLYILGDTKRLAMSMGLSMAWPVDIDPWWEVPHLAWLAARRAGPDAAHRCYDALVAARWQRGENICEPDVVRRAAVSAGLDPEPLVAAPDDPGLRADGVDGLVDAYTDDIFGVPYLRLGRHRFWGFDRVDMFVDVFRSTTDPGGSPPLGIPAVVPERIGCYDTDTAGGCG